MVCEANAFTAQSRSASDLDKQVEETKRHLETPVQTAEPSLGQRLKEVVKQRVNNRGLRAGFISARVSACADESFAEKLKQATKERISKHPQSQKSARERAEQESSRYVGRGGLQRRKRTKGE